MIYVFDYPFPAKMAASIRQNLTFFILKQASLNKNGGFCLSPVSATVSPSLSLHFFSTETPTHLHTVNPAVYNILVHKHGFPTQFSSWVASKVCDMKNAERVDPTLTFLKSSGFSNAHLQNILKYKPKYLSFSLEGNIKPQIKVLQEEGFSSGDISVMVSRCPNFLSLSLENNVIPSLSLLKDLSGSNTALRRALRTWPRLLYFNLEKTVVPNVEFLKSYGLSMDRIRVSFNCYPPAFILPLKALVRCVERVEEMGLSVTSKTFARALATASMGDEAWELKLQAFRDVGFSESDMAAMFSKEPRAFCSSAEKVKKITEGFVASGKFDISSIVEYPLSLLFSFEKRYEPRMRILRILESRNLIENWPNLQTLCLYSNAKFLEIFVTPYLDQLSDVCIPKLR